MEPSGRRTCCTTRATVPTVWTSIFGAFVLADSLEQGRHDPLLAAERLVHGGDGELGGREEGGDRFREYYGVLGIDERKLGRRSSAQRVANAHVISRRQPARRFS
jgi:hypothetical protein